MLRCIKLISNLLKKINEPFAKLWTKMTNVVMSIDETMMTILNNFNVYRQQKLDDPNNLNIEKEGLLDNPYGMKGGNTFLSDLTKDYKDGKWGRFPKKPNNNKPNIQLEGGYAGLSHPSRREMARYYGSGGSKYM